jgi:hypothetical protein
MPRSAEIGLVPTTSVRLWPAFTAVMAALLILGFVENIAQESGLIVAALTAGAG